MRATRTARRATRHRRSGRAPAAGQPAALHLQRQVGNRAVSRMLEIQRDNDERAPHTFGFTTQELDWIDEVWRKPGIRMMFQAYGEVPDPVLARVRRIAEDDGSDSATTEGIHHGAAEAGEVNIEIADTAYEIPGTAQNAMGGRRERTPKEEFTSTLIHELFHFVENNTQDLDPKAVATPGTLMIIMANPASFGFGPLGFGWFIHPVTERGLHLDAVEVGELLVGDQNTRVPADSEAGRVKAEGAYESSPDGRDIEEDLATTVAWYLTSPGTRQQLATDHPKRFALMAAFFQKLLPESLPESMDR